jgi:hypothetical protein
MAHENDKTLIKKTVIHRKDAKGLFLELPGYGDDHKPEEIAKEIRAFLIKRFGEDAWSSDKERTPIIVLEGEIKIETESHWKVMEY